VTELRVRVHRVRGETDSDIALPELATAGSAGADLRAAVDGEQILAPGERAAIPTGFALEIPAGYEGQVRARSGLALEHGISLPNAPGTIDSDYRGEIRVILHNGGEAPFVVRRGDRIAQLVIAPVTRPSFVEVDASQGLDPTKRSDGGFGHTGR
jgi:dUTP pyrophosphatase